MKQLRLVLLVLISFVVMSAKSQNVGDRFKSGQLYYEVTSESEVSVARQHFNEEVTGDVIIPETVTYEGKKYRVVAIGNSAFEHCSGLTSVTILNSVEKIGRAAFSSCEALVSVTISTSVMEIGEFPFSASSALTEIQVAEGNSSFSSIDGVLFDASRTLLIRYPEGKKEDLYEIPNSVKEIGDFAFGGCVGLTSVTISNSVQKIGRSSFVACSALEEIKVAEGNSSFSSIDGVLFDASRTLLILYPAGRKADSYEIPTFVEKIGYGAFAYCTGLSSITIPNTVKMIEDFAFTRCSGFTSVMIPNSIKEIGMAVFYDCTGLLSVTIPDSVEKIGRAAFSSCDALVTVTIPNSVKEIGAGAFEYCSSLKTVRSKIKEPNSVTLGEDVFIDLDTKVRTLQVPKGSKALYQAAEQWSAFANIEEEDYSATTAIRTSETKVWSEDGAIYISSGECGADGTASVYTPAGTLVAVIPLQEGANKLSIASGAYLVQVAGETYKVQVL